MTGCAETKGFRPPNPPFRPVFSRLWIIKRGKWRKKRMKSLEVRKKAVHLHS